MKLRDGWRYVVDGAVFGAVGAVAIIVLVKPTHEATTVLRFLESGEPISRPWRSRRTYAAAFKVEATSLPVLSYSASLHGPSRIASDPSIAAQYRDLRLFIVNDGTLEALAQYV